MLAGLPTVGMWGSALSWMRDRTNNHRMTRATTIIPIALQLLLCACGRVTDERKAESISIFNGKDLNGWHTSRSSHHGTTGKFYVEDGAITLKQNPYGQGGVLLSDKKYS